MKVSLMFTIIILATLGMTCLFFSPAEAQREVETILIFDLESCMHPQDIPVSLPIGVALKENLRKYKQVTISIFNPESPTLQRAISEGNLSPQDLEIPVKEERAFKIGRILGVSAAILLHLEGFRVNESPAEAEIEIKGKGIDFRINATLELQAKGAAKSRKKLSKDELIKIALQGAAEQLAKQIREKIVAVKPSPEERAQAHFQLGNQYFEKGAYKQAIMEYNRGRQLQPADLRFYLAICESYLKLDQLDNAIRELLVASQTDPENLELHLKIAQIYQKKGETASALAEYQKALEVAPDNISLRVALANLYTAVGEYDKAKDEFNKALELTPENPEIFLGLGNLYLTHGLLKEAEKEFAKAAKLRAGDSQVYETILRFYAEKKKYPQALEALKNIVNLRKDNSSPLGENEYLVFTQVTDAEFTSLYCESQEAFKKFKANQISREALFSIHKDLHSRALELTNIAQALKPPEKYSQSHQRRLLAYHLLTQSLCYQLYFIDTADQTYAQQSDLFLREALKELEKAHFIP